MTTVMRNRNTPDHPHLLNCVSHSFCDSWGMPAGSTTAVAAETAAVGAEAAAAELRPEGAPLSSAFTLDTSLKGGKNQVR